MQTAQDQPPPIRLDKQWLVVFADLIALLVAFFVLLFAMNSVNSTPWDRLTESFTVRLNPDQGRRDAAALTDRTAETTRSLLTADLDYLHAVVAEKMRDVPALAGAQIRRLDDRLVISLQSDAMFAPGSDTLTDEARHVVGLMGDALGRVRNRLAVGGHTDPRLPRNKRFASNWELSIARALAVADALRQAGYTREIAALGLADSRIVEISRGLPENERHRRARRVDIIVRDAYADDWSYGS